MTVSPWVKVELERLNNHDINHGIYHGWGGVSMSYHLLIESMARNYSIVLQELGENGGVQECSRAVCAAERPIRCSATLRHR